MNSGRSTRPARPAHRPVLSSGGVPFPLLADPAGYRACGTDLLVDEAARRYWLDLFESHLEVQLGAAAGVGVPPSALEAARSEFRETIDTLRRTPDRHRRLDILLLDELRQDLLHRHGVHDEFRLVKQRENELALQLLPEHLRRLDAVEPEARLEAIVRGMLAGNLFDMGVASTASRFSEGAVPFDRALGEVPPRPWLIDDLDRANAAWRERPPARAVLFADNAGADAVLGLLPLAREMLRRATEVVIAANSGPSLNDVTADELRSLCAMAAESGDRLRSPALDIVGNGQSAPLIDLARVSPELAEASAGADLVVLIGMGRAVESNLTARFTCRSWKVAMIKDPQVARSVGGRMFDAVFRVDEPMSAPPPTT